MLELGWLQGSGAEVGNELPKSALHMVARDQSAVTCKKQPFLGIREQRVISVMFFLTPVLGSQ